MPSAFKNNESFRDGVAWCFTDAFLWRTRSQAKQLCPRTWPSAGTFRRDLDVDSESERTQEVAVVCWSSPLSPSGAAKQVTKKEPLGCVNSQEKQANDLCLVNSCLLWLITSSATSDFYRLLREGCFLTFCTSPWCKAKLQLIRTPEKLLKEQISDWQPAKKKKMHISLINHRGHLLFATGQCIRYTFQFMCRGVSPAPSAPVGSNWADRDLASVTHRRL